MGDRPADQRPSRILVFVVAYHAETTLAKVLARIPSELGRHDLEVLVIDDASTDRTFEIADEIRGQAPPFGLTVLANPVNQGYGGNQKLGYRYAIDHGFDAVALLHGDGQYAPEALPALVAPILAGEADAVFGSRMLRPLDALGGGMPLYKFLGNRVLSWYENLMLGTKLSEFHSGLRVYSVEALRTIPFELNTNLFHFDTEIIIQLVFAGKRIVELPIPTHYGDEICRVNGLVYACDCFKAVTVAFLQQFNLVYRRNLDCRSERQAVARDSDKTCFASPQSRALALVRPGDAVLEIGGGAGTLVEPLKARGCRVVGVGAAAPPADEPFDRFVASGLDDVRFEGLFAGVDRVLLLDVLEHAGSPERVCEALHRASQESLDARLLVSLPNVAFVVVRLMLLLGWFNYGRRGILDLTHTRLLTFASARRLFQESGFEVELEEGIPPPYPLVVGGRLARLMMLVHGWLIRLWPALFSFQIFMVLRPLPTVSTLLERARANTDRRRQARADAPGA